MSTCSIKNDEDIYDLNLSKFLQTDLLVGYQVKSSFDYKLLKGVFGKDILRNLNKDKRRNIVNMHSLDVFEVERKLQHLSEEVAWAPSTPSNKVILLICLLKRPQRLMVRRHEIAIQFRCTGSLVSIEKVTSRLRSITTSKTRRLERTSTD